MLFSMARRKIMPMKKADQIHRRIYEFLRFHNIPFVKYDGYFFIGGAYCRAVDGYILSHLPQVKKWHGIHVSFSLYYSCPYTWFGRFLTHYNSCRAIYRTASLPFVPGLFQPK